MSSKLTSLACLPVVPYPPVSTHHAAPCGARRKPSVAISKWLQTFSFCCLCFCFELCKYRCRTQLLCRFLLEYDSPWEQSFMQFQPCWTISTIQMNLSSSNKNSNGSGASRIGRGYLVPWPMGDQEEMDSQWNHFPLLCTSSDRFQTLAGY